MKFSIRVLFTPEAERSRAHFMFHLTFSNLIPVCSESLLLILEVEDVKCNLSIS